MLLSQLEDLLLLNGWSFSRLLVDSWDNMVVVVEEEEVVVVRMDLTILSCSLLNLELKYTLEKSNYNHEKQHEISSKQVHL